MSGFDSSPVCKERRKSQGCPVSRTKHRLEGDSTDQELSGDEDNHRSLVGRGGLGVHGRDLVLDGGERQAGEFLDDRGGALELLSLEREHRVVALWAEGARERGLTGDEGRRAEEGRGGAEKQAQDLDGVLT